MAMERWEILPWFLGTKRFSRVCDVVLRRIQESGWYLRHDEN